LWYEAGLFATSLLLVRLLPTKPLRHTDGGTE
jgi:hypothetical protein